MGFVEVNSFRNAKGLLEKVTEYRSDKTGLRVILADCKSGGIFRLEIVVPTAGSSDKGEPHCLEHLCFRGCERFPVSGILDSLPCLASETNAYTATDRTVYTTTTASEIGLVRLLPLYLEHLHFPVLSSDSAIAKASFNTEVFHVNEEFASAGVVYCEMETAFSEPSEIASYATLKAAYPEDCKYRWNTGGDPAAIPSLTLDNIRDCHSAHYVAANTTIVVMGAIKNPENLLATLVRYENEVYTKAFPPGKERQLTSPVWAHMEAPDIPSSIQIVTHSPSEQDSQDHYVSYAFRLKFPWCNTKKRVAMDTALRYLVEGSGAILNKEFVEGENACAGSISYSVDNVLWSLAVISFNDVEANQSLSLAQQVTSAIRSHMARNFDLTRLRSILQREVWKHQSLLEVAPHRACFEKIVSYAVNCYCQKDCSEHHGSVTDGHDLQSVIDEVSAYTDLLTQPETFWRNFIRSGIELSEKYVVIVKPSTEMAHKRVTDRIQLTEKRRAENTPTFAVAKHTAATESTRKKNLEAFVREFSEKNPPLMSVSSSLVPACEDKSGIKGLKPASICASYDSAFTTINISAKLVNILNQSLEVLHQRPDCRQELTKHALTTVYDEIIQTEITEDVTEAIDDLYANPTWEKTLMPSDESDSEDPIDPDESDNEEDDSDDNEESDSDESSSESSDRLVEDLGSLSSDEKNVIVAYQFDLASSAYLQWVLRRFSGKHLLPIVSKCLFYSHLEMPSSVYRGLLRAVNGGDLKGGDVCTVTPETLETFLNANFLDYYASNGMDSSPAFNELISITLKLSSEQFEIALKTIQVVLKYTKVEPGRVLAMAKQELSYLTEDFKQAESLVADINERQAYGDLDSLVTCQSDFIQNILLRAIVNYPHIFAPLINCVIREFETHVCSGDCLITILGDIRALEDTRSNSIVGVTFPNWLAAQTQILPTFASIASYNKLLVEPVKKKRLNLQWNAIEVGHLEALTSIPKSIIPPGCDDLSSHKICRECAGLIVAESFLRTTEGPIFQPIRDAGAAYSASMTIGEEGRTIALSLSDSAQPTEAYAIALENLKSLVQNCDSVLQRLRDGISLDDEPHIPFPTPEQFSRAKSGAIFQAVKDLDNPTRVAEKMIENRLRQLDNDWMFEKLSNVTFEQFVSILKELGSVFISGEYDLVIVSNSFHAKALHERFPDLTKPLGFVESIAASLIDEKDQYSETYRRLLALILKTRISLLSSECDN